jgi:hypothetical protein
VGRRHLAAGALRKSRPLFLTCGPEVLFCDCSRVSISGISSKYPTILICLNVPRAQQTREALGAFQKAEIERWWPILKEAGIRNARPRQPPIR